VWPPGTGTSNSKEGLSRSRRDGGSQSRYRGRRKQRDDCKRRLRNEQHTER
jgi:hypothetical protein